MLEIIIIFVCLFFSYESRIHDNSFRQGSLMELKFKKNVSKTKKKKINTKLEVNSTDYGKSYFQKNLGVTCNPYVIRYMSSLPSHGYLG